MVQLYVLICERNNISTYFYSTRGGAPSASVGKRPRVEEMAPKGARVACEAQRWGLEPISQCSRSPSEASLLHTQ